NKKTVRNNRGMEKRYIIYARKSTRSDERQKLSIPAQLKALRQFAEQNNLAIFKVITERMSAHVVGRPLFDQMLKHIEAGEASGILAWHPDRLARNSADGSRIIEFLDLGKLVDLKFYTFWFENTPQGKANLGHEFVQSKQFSDKLACDTMRGQREKAEMGYYPGIAPRGYLNNVATKTVVPDPQLAPIIRKAFERYAEGNLTIDDIRRELAKGGITTRANSQWKSNGGNMIHRDLVRRMLSNPFYYGHFVYAGIHYEGKHEPLISQRLFDRVQTVLAGRCRPKSPERLPKAFTRLLSCGHCRMAVTAEVQKGHVYYRCTRKSRIIACAEPFIREEHLERDISRMLADCTMPDNWATYMLGRLSDEARESAATAKALVQEKNEALIRIGMKRQKLLAGYLDEIIKRDAFVEENEKLLKEKRRIEEQIKLCEEESTPWL